MARRSLEAFIRGISSKNEIDAARLCLAHFLYDSESSIRFMQVEVGQQNIESLCLYLGERIVERPYGRNVKAEFGEHAREREANAGFVIDE